MLAVVLVGPTGFTQAGAQEAPAYITIIAEDAVIDLGVGHKKSTYVTFEAVSACPQAPVTLVSLMRQTTNSDGLVVTYEVDGEPFAPGRDQFPLDYQSEPTAEGLWRATAQVELTVLPGPGLREPLDGYEQAWQPATWYPAGPCPQAYLEPAQVDGAVFYIDADVLSATQAVAEAGSGMPWLGLVVALAMLRRR